MIRDAHHFRVLLYGFHLHRCRTYHHHRRLLQLLHQNQFVILDQLILGVLLHHPHPLHRQHHLQNQYVIPDQQILDAHRHHHHLHPHHHDQQLTYHLLRQPLQNQFVIQVPLTLDALNH